MIPIQQSLPTKSFSASDAQRIMDSIRQIVRALRVSSREADRSVGITGAQLFVLRKLDANAAASLNELAARTLTHQSTVSVVVSRLVEKGLVLRSVSQTDARRVVLRLSARGRAFLGRAPETTQERLVRAIEHLTQRKRAALRDLLSAIVKGSAISRETPELFFEGEVGFDNKQPLPAGRPVRHARVRK